MNTWYVMFLFLFYAFGLFKDRYTCLLIFTSNCVRTFAKFTHGFELVGGVVEYLGITMLLIDSINFRIALRILQSSIHTFYLHRKVELRIMFSKHIKLLVQSGKRLGQSRDHDKFSLSLGGFDVEIFLNRISGFFQRLQNLREVI